MLNILILCIDTVLGYEKYFSDFYWCPPCKKEYLWNIKNDVLNKVRKCHFDKEIIKYINNGVCYLGGSAGAHIVTKNIKHILAFEKNYAKIKNYNAIGLFDGILFCHYSEKREQQYINALKNKENNVYKLTNEEKIELILRKTVEVHNKETLIKKLMI